MNTFMKRKDAFELTGIGCVKIRQGRHIKTLSVRLAPGRGIWVNVPCGVSLRQAESFVQAQRDWIREQAVKMKVYEQNTGVGLGIGTEVKTKYHVLRVLSCEESTPHYHIEGNEVRLFIPCEISYAQVAPYVEHFLIEIYKMECRQYLPGRVRELADRFGFRYGRLSFRNNLSNWGSCSGEDHISLNVKLMKLPDAVIDYVILHELCHTVEKNHSDRFWTLVGKVCPNYVALRRQLKTYNTRI